MKVVCLPESGQEFKGGMVFDRQSKRLAVWMKTVEMSVTLDDEQIKTIGECMTDSETATVHAAGNVAVRVAIEEETK